MRELRSSLPSCPTGDGAIPLGDTCDIVGEPSGLMLRLLLSPCSPSLGGVGSEGSLQVTHPATALRALLPAQSRISEPLVPCLEINVLRHIFTHFCLIPQLR